MAFHLTEFHETLPLLTAVVTNSCTVHQDRSLHTDSMGVNAFTPLSTPVTEPSFTKLTLDEKLS